MSVRPAKTQISQHQASLKKKKMSVRPLRRSQHQPVHQASLIRVFAVCSLGSWRSNISSCEQRRLWSTCASAQSDQRLRCPNEESLGHFVGFDMRRLNLFITFSVRLLPNRWNCFSRKHEVITDHVFCYPNAFLKYWLLTGGGGGSGRACVCGGGSQTLLSYI